MAEKKHTSQTVTEKKSGARRPTKAELAAEQKSAKKPSASDGFRARLIGAAVCLAVAILLLVVLFKPEGVIMKAIHSVLLGLMGNAGFYAAIPAVIYAFIILISASKRPVRLRCVCVALFVFSCGCIAHLALNPQELPEGFKLISGLYTGGVQGTTGGVICGLVSMLLVWLFGRVVSYIAFILAAVFTLLAAIGITVPSLIRAIQERPRPEQEEITQRPEPAAIVVNHIATKHMEHTRQKREKQQRQQTGKAQEQRKPSEAAVDLMRQIDMDPEASLVPSEAPLEKHEIEPLITAPDHSSFVFVKGQLEPAPDSESEPAVPPEMPPLVKPEPVSEPPKAKHTEKKAERKPETPEQEIKNEIEQNQSRDQAEYCYPPLSLLRDARRSGADGTAEMRENSERLNDTLASFKIEAHITNVIRGPSVTRYEVELEKGVRLNKLTTCADDIALSLGASSVRIAAVEGKISVVGIEVPNRAVTTVSLREVIDAQEFQRAKSRSSFAVGKDIGGSCVVGDIAKLPHMLIAGTTGSGKSVCMNSIIISLLYKASPDDVKLIMVDPKMVELGVYNGIPHLLIPVVTDPKKAAGSLQWAVTEMMRRYRSMSDAGVRDVAAYNSLIDTQELDGEHLPQVVVIIDELADLMLVASKEVEESICRIAQMGRAAGIHLIIATQRPSADVITGLMKANIPSRIAFSVASAMESRIILDTTGAEKLVGRGDMLYAPVGCGKPRRVQGCFVSDEEVEAVAAFVKEHYLTQYDEQVMQEIDRKAEQTGNKQSSDSASAAPELSGDELLPDAVDVILETGQASVTLLQRRLKLGYARAARIVDEMEDLGIVGPFVGSKPRAILVTKQQWEAMKNGQAPQMDFDDLADQLEPVPEEIE